MYNPYEDILTAPGMVRSEKDVNKLYQQKFAYAAAKYKSSSADDLERYKSIRSSNPAIDFSLPWVQEEIAKLRSTRHISTEKAKRICRRKLFRQSRAYDRLNSLKNTATSERCFVLGNGPSLNGMNLEVLKNEDTFVTNWFALSDICKTISPTYYCISSHELFGGWNNPRPEFNKDLYKIINKNCKNSTHFFSFAFSDYLENNDMFEQERLHYLLFEKPKYQLDEEGELITDLSRHMHDGYTGIITFCIPLALHMGYKEIILLGCDCDYKIQKNSQEKAYFYNYKLHTSKTTSTEGLQRAWAANGPAFRSYEIVKNSTSSARIYNATAGGKLEIFERKNFNLFFNANDIKKAAIEGKPKKCKPQKINLATVVNNNYVEGCICMLTSFLATNEWFDGHIIIIFERKACPLSAENKNRIISIYPKIIFREAVPRNYQSIWQEASNKIQTPERLYPAFYLLEVFKQRDEEAFDEYTLCLDSDLLVLKDISKLLSIPEGGLQACQAYIYKNGNKEAQPFFNTGVMLIDHQQLGNDAYKSLLLHKIKDNYNPAWGKADQAILNDAIGIDSISLFPETMNITKRKYPNPLGKTNIERELFDINIIHYVGEKPWSMPKVDEQYSGIEALWHAWHRYISSKGVNTIFTNPLEARIELLKILKRLY